MKKQTIKQSKRKWFSLLLKTIESGWKCLDWTLNYPNWRDGPDWPGRLGSCCLSPGLRDVVHRGQLDQDFRRQRLVRTERLPRVSRDGLVVHSWLDGGDLLRAARAGPEEHVQTGWALSRSWLSRSMRQSGGDSPNCVVRLLWSSGRPRHRLKIEFRFDSSIRHAGVFWTFPLSTTVLVRLVICTCDCLIGLKGKQLLQNYWQKKSFLKPVVRMVWKILLF